MCDIYLDIHRCGILANHKKNYYNFGGKEKLEQIDMCDITPGNM